MRVVGSLCVVLLGALVGCSASQETRPTPSLYSRSQKSGRRRWLNPYLGARVGFAQTQNRGDFAAAGVFGLELFKTAVLMIDLQVRAMALVGNPDGPHAAVQPSLGFDLGF